MPPAIAVASQRRRRLSPVWSIILGLIFGIAIGATLRATGAPLTSTVVAVAEVVGGFWLNALRMTIIPLVVALIIAGVASTGADDAGRVPARAVGLFVVMYAGTVLVTALLTPTLFGLWPVHSTTAQSLQLAAAADTTKLPELPPLIEWVRTLIPANPIAAAAEGALLPLIIFALFVGFALRHGERAIRDRSVSFFKAIADTLLIIVRWVLWTAPVGVFALGLVLSGRGGLGAVGGLIQFIMIVSVVVLSVGLLAYPLAYFAGRVAPLQFARAAIPAQAVAISTQSSLASLPAMIEGVQSRLGRTETAAGVVLPLAVSLFRITGPAAMLTAAYFTAQVYGLGLPLGALVFAGLVAIVISVGSVSLPGHAAFFAKYVPVFTALGLPLEFLSILLAAEVVSDMFQTVANVTHDMAVATVLDRPA